jgi:hypothetical protein
MTQPISIVQQRKFSNASDYDAFSAVRLGNGCVTSLGGRNTWVRIDSAAGRSAYRMIRGVGSMAGFPADAIEIDYETSMSLGIPRGTANPLGFYPCALSIRPATRWEIVRAHWNHPDHGYRFPLQISLVGLFLGVVGLVLGVLSLR